MRQYYEPMKIIPGGFSLTFRDETFESLQESFIEELADASLDEGYEQWYRNHCETIGGLALQKNLSFPYQPTISLVLPLYKEDMCYVPAALLALFPTDLFCF